MARAGAVPPAPLPPHERVESVRGAMQERDSVNQALAGVTHVLHLATCKETPDE